MSHDCTASAGAISHYLTPETMDGDNMWRLDSGEMVHAVKGMWPLKLPGIMVMDLQRCTSYPSSFPHKLSALS